jgi:hypothetical protein
MLNKFLLFFVLIAICAQSLFTNSIFFSPLAVSAAPIFVCNTSYPLNSTDFAITTSTTGTTGTVTTPNDLIDTNYTTNNAVLTDTTVGTTAKLKISDSTAIWPKGSKVIFTAQDFENRPGTLPQFTVTTFLNGVQKDQQLSTWTSSFSPNITVPVIGFVYQHGVNATSSAFNEVEISTTASLANYILRVYKATLTTAACPVAVSDNYSTIGYTPVTINPITADTGVDITLKSINGVVLTPGVAQTITTTNGVVNTTSANVISFTPNAGFLGLTTIPYIIQDSGNNTATANQVINVLPAPQLELDKIGTFNDTNANNIGEVGETITYQFTVKNTGNTPITALTISDPNATIAGGPLATLAVGATNTTTFVGTHTLTAADIVLEYVDNQATVSGKDPSNATITDLSNDPSTVILNDKTRTLIPQYAAPDSASTPLNTPVTFSPLTNDSVATGSTISAINGTIVVVGAPISVTDGIIIVNSNGTITVTPNTGYIGTISFSYEVTAPNGTKVSANGSVSVTAVATTPVSTAANLLRTGGFAQKDNAMTLTILAILAGITTTYGAVKRGKRNR